MSLDEPPIYYFNGIDYNGSFYGTNPTTGAGGGITTSYANSNYLKRTGGDILSTALSTTFTGALNSNSGITTPQIKAINYMCYNARVYPPELVAGATISGTSSTVIAGKLVITQTYTVGDQGIAYGLGKYILYSSPLFNGSFQLSKLFDNISTGITDADTVAWLNGNYTNGLFNYNTGIDSTYFGDWFIIKYPNPIILRKFEIYNLFSTTETKSRAPGEWKFYGSNDGVTFIEISGASQLTRISTTDYDTGGNKYTKTISGLTTPYLYYGMCVNKLAGSTSLLHISEFKLYGDESVMNTTSDILKFNGSMYVTQRSNYSSINQYPPRLYDTSTSATSSSILGQSCYLQQVTLNYVTGSYGTGNYNLYMSSIYDPLVDYPSKLFDYLSAFDSTNAMTNITYNSAGVYIDSPAKYIKSDYTGEFIIINLPQSIILKYYSFYIRTAQIYRAPKEWKVYGSTDGSIFEEIVDASQTTPLNATDYTNNTNRYTKTVPNQTKYYNWLGFCFNKIFGNGSFNLFMELNELRLYGTEQTISEDYALKVVGGGTYIYGNGQGYINNNAIVTNTLTAKDFIYAKNMKMKYQGTAAVNPVGLGPYTISIDVSQYVEPLITSTSTIWAGLIRFNTNNNSTDVHGAFYFSIGRTGASYIQSSHNAYSPTGVSFFHATLTTFTYSSTINKPVWIYIDSFYNTII